MGKPIAMAWAFLLMIAPAVYAQTTHTVGGTNSGWTTNVDYGSWAKSQTFTVGDSLLFNYDFTHAVDEVTESGYTSCSSANAISSSSNSPTTITLSAAGTRYFICPRSNHCNQGMKLAVTVVAASSGAPSPPSGGAAPHPPPSGGTTTPSSPPPPKNGSPPTTLMMPLVLGAILGLMVGVMG